ncbi:MAG: OB-fold nucleic acid binding domain-containing protein [Candidatus Aenigmarchaeota archaeon]|nr:OB-fold nucleic acid binding domain-containing protein [Candidatus Aenigmarchaeota archaeon]
MEKKRITTVKTRLHYIHSGKFVTQEGFNPNYVISEIGERLARVRIFGAVVDKFVAESGKFAAVTVDDGTDTIRVKVFNAVSMLENVAEGNNVDIIGRVKEYNGEIYIMPETILPVSDPNFEILRELEIRQHEAEIKKKRDIILSHKNQVSDVAELVRMMEERYGMDPELVETILQLESDEKPSVDVKKILLELIQSTDKGDGCDYSELIAASGLPENELDSAINELLEEGLCFEPRPGKIRRL